MFASSRDGTRVAYDVTGQGPALVLLHGAGKTRRDWHKVGYVERLEDDFSVIAVDLRGTGESDVLTEVSDYQIERICEDVTAVADACGAERFRVWGYSFGGHVGKYLAALTDRVVALAVIGVHLWGPTVDEPLDRFITDFDNKWRPWATTRRAGNPVEQAKRSAIKSRVPVWLACFEAMRSWPAIEPGGIKCPSLLVAGAKGQTGAAEWAEANSEALESAGFQADVISGLDHLQEFTEIDRVFPVVRQFFEEG